MQAKRIFTAVLVIAAVTILVVFALCVRIGVTADSVAVLKTSGLTCGACSSQITQALQTVKGVAATEVDVNGGWVTVGYDAKAVRPETLAEKVTRTGFNCKLSRVLTPQRFRQLTGRNIGQDASSPSGCCGKGGCGANKN